MLPTINDKRAANKEHSTNNDNAKINIKAMTIANITDIQSHLTALIESNNVSSRASHVEEEQKSFQDNNENLVIVRDALRWWKMSKFLVGEMGSKLTDQLKKNGHICETIS